MTPREIAAQGWRDGRAMYLRCGGAWLGGDEPLPDVSQDGRLYLLAFRTAWIDAHAGRQAHRDRGEAS